MGYEVQFLRVDGVPERSAIFETFQGAQTHAAQELPQKNPKVMTIIEVDDDGEDVRIHEIQVF